ncbi:DNA-binding domain-containing protein [Rubellimicrobium roseum]|uniref:DUF2063 domain-containing protein n=1 Tax=Rubellimicrobium roseum TaxID=687525 RepID=A0A5C4NK92_9RHOB|nr:putative DNA-binding domain-containing protein [Rubellimicrobium roseum]TNC73087.1 DUF2063 domain-containing protein [Rubellimicrobium roseum]
MPSHPDLVAAFRSGVWTGALPPGVTARDPAEAARRFAVHRNNVAHGLSEALATRFPVVRRLVGERFFSAMARAFAQAHPPESPVLLAWGGAFPQFLEAFPPATALPYLPDVARLETALGLAYHAGDAEPLSPADLVRLAQEPDTARLGLHPSVQVVASCYAIVSIWRANRPGAPARPVAAVNPETALVLRDRRLDVIAQAISPGDAAFLSQLRDGDTLLAFAAAASVEPGHDPAPLLARLVSAGVLVAPALPPMKDHP